MSVTLPICRILQKRKILCLLFTFIVSAGMAQEKMTVTGRVTDGGTPLPNVSVQIQGTGLGTKTNENGVFTITAAKGQVLVFSYVGYEMQKLTIADQKEINTNLKPSTDNALNDVVVVGYGTKKKVNLTGAVSVVSAKQLEDRPITNVASALQGTMSGVTVVQNTGQPGKDQGLIRVR